MTDLAHWTSLDWSPPPRLTGEVTRLARLTADHAAQLHAANPTETEHWAYMHYGPFADIAAYSDWVARVSVTDDPAFYAIMGPAGWAGVASFMRVDRDNGVIEIGNIALSPPLQQTRAATEALHLMIDHAFAAGFRRVEWKCNAENAPSCRAALRLGFSHEGTFRQHMIVKGANRDTAWFAITDGDWPRLRLAHRTWLATANFDASGQQIRRLGDLTG